jgi:hypothetical protein
MPQALKHILTLLLSFALTLIFSAIFMAMGIFSAPMFAAILSILMSITGVALLIDIEYFALVAILMYFFAALGLGGGISAGYFFYCKLRKRT